MSTVANLLDSKGHDVLTVHPGLPVRDTLAQMAELSVSTAVVTESGKVTGIVSERDVIRKVVLESKNIADVAAREIMSTDLTVVAAETSIENCMKLMTEKRIRHLPVMCGEKLCGIVSIGDVVKFLAAEQGFTIQNLENYISGSM
jgi:CBS domain-containing protein